MSRGDEDECFVPASEDEAIEVERLLMEPVTDHVSVDGVFRSEKNLAESMQTKDIPCIFDEQGAYSSQQALDGLQEKVVNATSHEVKFQKLQIADICPNTCEDYLLDIACPENVTNSKSGSSKNPHVKISWGDHDTLGPVAGTQSDELDNVICELPSISSFECKRETSYEDKWLKYSTFDLENFGELEDVSSLMSEGISFDKSDVIFPGERCGGTSITNQNSEDSPISQVVERNDLNGQDLSRRSSVEASSDGGLLTQKRLRKPTRRYIDESTDFSSRYCRKRLEISTSTSKGEFMGIRCHKRRHMESRSRRLVQEESSSCKAIQVPFGPELSEEFQAMHASVALKRTEKRRKEKLVPVTESSLDEKASRDEWEEECAATERSEDGGGGGRRKHHKPWAISEVKKLIDGVSQFGVGRWMDIKRHMFSLSDHRTSVDLKDKWRNLLKASSFYRTSQKKLMQDEEKRSHAWRPLPRSMLSRVNELAMIYPYPRDRKSKLSFVTHVSSPVTSTRRTGVPLGLPGKENVSDTFL